MINKTPYCCGQDTTMQIFSSRRIDGEVEYYYSYKCKKCNKKSRRAKDIEKAKEIFEEMDISPDVNKQGGLF